MGRGGPSLTAGKVCRIKPRAPVPQRRRPLAPPTPPPARYARAAARPRAAPRRRPPAPPAARTPAPRAAPAREPGFAGGAARSAPGRRTEAALATRMSGIFLNLILVIIVGTLELEILVFLNIVSYVEICFYMCRNISDSKINYYDTKS